MAGAAQIAQDLWCRKCRYNLRTLRVEGVCPECATPVQESLNHVREMGRTDFRRLAWGAGVLALLAFLGTFHGIYIQPMYGRWEFIRYYVPLGIDMFLDEVLPWAHALAFPPLLLLGVFFLATSRRPERRSPWPSRWAVLAACVYALATGAAFIALFCGYLGRPPGQSAPRWDFLFVQLEAGGALAEDFWDHWLWTLLIPLYLLFFFLLASGARFLNTLLHRADYPRLARATFLILACPLILAMGDLLLVALVYVQFHIAAIFRDEASWVTFLRTRNQLQVYLYLSFYVPMLLYWFLLFLLFRRLDRRWHGLPSTPG